MPTKEKTYNFVIFSPEVMSEAETTLVTSLPQKNLHLSFQSLSVELPNGEEWEHDNDDEFFTDFRKGFKSAYFRKEYMAIVTKFPQYQFIRGGIRFSFHGLTTGHPYTKVLIEMPTRADLERVFEVIECNVEKSRIPEPPVSKPSKRKRRRPRIKIFVGHGHNDQWKELKDHLHEKHNFDVEHYEHGSRAGLTVKEVLDEMLTESSFALLVLTGEDQDAEGELHARENVIHELGLFQGRLGWRKAIALLEEGVKEFSNIHGLNQIRFAKGRIRETFGEVLATIRREFSQKE